MSEKDKVYDYLYNQNRPFSANDIFTNLHKDIGKSAVSKVLDALVEEGKITEKVYNKQKVYLINQNELPTENLEDQRTAEAKLRKLEAELKTVTSDIHKTEIELKTVGSSMTTEEMKKLFESVEAEIAFKSDKLKNIEENQENISAEDKEKIVNERNTVLKEWRKRKRLAKDMIDTVLEVYPKTKKEFMEEVGIELDEDYNVQIPEK